MAQRVLYVIDQLPVGGAERVFLDLLSLMNDRISFDACLITGGGKLENEIPAHVTLHNLRRENKFSLISAFKAYKLFKQYHILHVHMRHNFRYVYLIKILSGLKAKVLLHDHYGSIGIDSGPPFKFWKFLKPDIYIGVCEALKIWAIDTWRLPASSCFTFANLPREDCLNVKIQKCNSEKPNGFVILGNIKQIKNQELGLAIACLLSKKLVLIGRNQDEKYYHYIKKVAKNIQLTILEDINEPFDELSKFELGLCTSISESGPLVVLEYLLCGLPFLSFKTGGISDIVSEYFPEYFIDNHDPEAWVIRIHKILSEHDTINQVVVTDMLKKYFSPDLYRDRLLSIYAEA